MNEPNSTKPIVESDRPSAIEIGQALSAIMRSDGGNKNADRVWALVYGMVTTEGTAVADAIPVAQIASALAADLLRRQPEPTTDEELGMRNYLLILAGLANRTCRTLEAATGIPADAYLGNASMAN